MANLFISQLLLIPSFILWLIIYSNFDDKILVLTFFTGKCKPKLRSCERGQCLFFNLEFRHRGSVSECEFRLTYEFQLWKFVLLTCQTNFWLRIKEETQIQKIFLFFNLKLSKIKKFADILFCSPVKFLKIFFLLSFFLRCQISKENFSKPGKLFLELPKENFQLIDKEEIRTKSHKIYCKYTLIKEVQN